MVSKMNKADLYKAYKVLDFSHKKIEMELNDMKECHDEAMGYGEENEAKWAECDDLREENDSLKEENKELKEENEKISFNLLSSSLGELNKISTENEKLKEENKKLKLSRTGQAQEYYALSKSYDKLKEENEKLKEKYEKYRVRNCDRMEELVKALSPWKKNHEDHKRILEAIVELKEEHQKLLDDIELHPDYEETIKSTIEEFIKSMKEKIDEESDDEEDAAQAAALAAFDNDSDDESNPPCVTCGGCHGRFVDGESYCDDWDCVNSDDEEVSFCGVNGHRCEECTDCARSKVCDTCKCVGGCYEDCLSNS